MPGWAGTSNHLDREQDAHRWPAQEGILDLSFTTLLSWRRFLASDDFTCTIEAQKEHIRHATAFAVSGMYTYVRDKELTLADLRGSRRRSLSSS